jgi:1-deoxy-D-xylulose-5-phosphate reductoisomerase
VKRFPCLALAQEIAREENTLPCVLNAANEIVVAQFLDGEIRFHEIAQHIRRITELHKPVSRPTLEDIFEADSWARLETQKLLAASRT